MTKKGLKKIGPHLWEFAVCGLLILAGLALSLLKIETHFFTVFKNAGQFFILAGGIGLLIVFINSMLVKEQITRDERSEYIAGKAARWTLISMILFFIIGMIWYTIMPFAKQVPEFLALTLFLMIMVYYLAYSLIERRS